MDEFFCEDEYHSNWLIEMFKSMTKITFDGISFIYLLEGIPLSLFFAEKESQSKSQSNVLQFKSNLEEISFRKLPSKES